MTKEEIQDQIKKCRNKISRLEGELKKLLLEEKKLECTYKVGDIVEVCVSQFSGKGKEMKYTTKWFPVEITKLAVYSAESPNLLAKYKHLTKEGKNQDQCGSFYFSHTDRYRTVKKENSCI